MSNNYTLGRGKIYFARYLPNTQTPGPELYIGNTPEFSLTIEEEKLDHFSSEAGVREKDASISLQVNRSGQMVTDNISPENVALFFFGTSSTVEVTGATITNEAIDGDTVAQGGYIQLGVSDTHPAGHRLLTPHSTGPTVNAVVTGSGGTPTYVEGDDYTIDMDLGRIYIVPGGDIADGTDLLVDYKTTTSSQSRVISGSTPVEGLMRFISNNPNGDNQDYLLPYVKISPNGDYSLISDEWQQIPFNVEVLKKTGREAVYVDGRRFA